MKHTYKKLYYLVGIIFIFGIVFFVYTHFKEDAILEKNKVEAVTDTSKEIKQQVIHEGNLITEKNSSYDIEVTYPVVASVLDGSKEINDFFSTLYSKKIKDFKDEVMEWNKDMGKLSADKEYPSSYFVSFSEEASSSRYISFLVLSEKYFVTAAHPSHATETFIYDKKNKKIVSVEDLFSSNASTTYTTLSSLSIKEFSIKNKKNARDGTQIDTSTKNEGFYPMAENFSKVLPTPDGLTIYFEEYQIASYVDGPQEVTIPYSKLKTIINKDGVLAEYK